MSTAAVSFRTPYFAWSASPEDERRFRRTLGQALSVALLACLVFGLLPKPKEVRVVQEIPPRLAKLLLERAAVAVPPPPTLPSAKLQPMPRLEAKTADKTERPEPKRPEPKQEAAKGAPVPEARNPQPNQPPGEVDAARKRVAGIGLLASSKELNELRGAPVAVQLATDIKQGPGVGTGVGVGVGAGTEAGVPVRALITSNAQGGSGGVNTAAFSRHTGGGGLAGRATTLVEGAAGGGGGGGAGGGGAGGKGSGTGLGSGDGARAGGTLARGASGKAARSIEEIKLVFERNKGAIYALYNRALRDDASLQGKVVVELKIAPSGEVVGCRIVSSELKTPELETKLAARIRGFDFGAKDVDTMVVTWPVDFLPS